MTRSGPSYKAMMERIAVGTPFKSRELADLAKAAGMKYGASQLANQVTQGERAAGNICVVGKDGAANIWQHTAHAPPKGAPAVVRSPAVCGPLDPSSAVEGGNTGLTEFVAEWLWQEVGGQGQNPSKEGVFVEINPMEAFGWRIVADKLIRRLLDLGMRGPGPPPDVSGTWTIPWNYNLGEWAVQDKDGSFVASLLDGEAAYIIAAAPSMRNAILAALKRYDDHGGIKREDIDALRASLPTSAPDAPPLHPTPINGESR